MIQSHVIHVLHYKSNNNNNNQTTKHLQRN